MVREDKIIGAMSHRYLSAIKRIKFLAWSFRWWGWILNPLMEKFGNPIAQVGFRYCSNCMYRHSCGACILFAGAVTPVNILQVMHDNNIKCLHPNWKGVFYELENIYKMCKSMKEGNCSWSDKYKL